MGQPKIRVDDEEIEFDDDGPMHETTVMKETVIVILRRSEDDTESMDAPEASDSGLS